MERHNCKLCSKSFTNGRALGGHMRSHLATLPIPPKIHHQQLGDKLSDHHTESDSSLSEEEEERESEEKALAYGLRENPKKSFRLVDPEFLDAGSVVQDRESETESTRNTTRRRLKRSRKMGGAEKPKLRKPSSTESIAEIEPASSVSDTSPEEDVALCLMMLSRDSWSTSDDSDVLKPSQTRRKYQCDECNRVFRSFQALGGHRTSHKKIKNSFQVDHEDNNSTHNVDQKVYKCPFCAKVFGSGQALGGHKRSHLLSSSSSTISFKFGGNLLDLNQPPPMEDEDYRSHQT
ncbi:zinc finger protein ZAT1 [Cornus florida]|uniref:zinc finger protein ZAT1 n=1 Tax=Cornus florida TaxID=4283 RepID=UPI0028A18CCE|nr:zinc finger protein ZAT1 [Cornus florida]